MGENEGGIYINRLVLVIGLTTLIFNGIGTNHFVKAETEAEKEEVIIVFKKDKVLNEQLVLENDGEVGVEFENIPAMTASLSEDAINELEKNPNVLSIEIDEKVHLLNEENIVNLESVEIKSQTEDWGLSSVKAKNAWNLGITGKGIKVAVLDTGIESSHPDLNVVGGVSFINEKDKNGVLTDSYEDFHGHGTHVAGIIGAKNNSIGTKGIAYNTDIYAVKIMNSTGAGYTSDVVSGIDWSISNGMDVVNLSIGSQSTSSAYQEIFKKAQEAGIVVLAAAGNDNLDNDSGVDYPAKFEETVGVASITSSMKHSEFSSVGPEVDVAAPGSSILSSYIGGTSARMSGTSMATPYASGMVALYKEAYPELSVTELLDKLYANVVDVEDVGFDNKTGRGLIQFPSSIKEPAEGFEKTITTFEQYNLYSSAKDSAKTIYVVSPQKLNAISKQGEFIQINTWMGKMYIKPELYLVGEKKVTTKKVRLLERTDLYDLPFKSKKISATLSPQQVYTVEEINGWYVVQTWLGYKYMKPKAAMIEDYVETIRLSYRTELLTQPDDKFKVGATVSPQTVTTLDKRGDYYKIKTWLGDRWIRPTNPIVGEIVPYTEKITIDEREKLHTLPFSKMSTGASISAGQTVQAIEKWNNWVLIKTWLGNMWIES